MRAEDQGFGPEIGDRRCLQPTAYVLKSTSLSSVLCLLSSVFLLAGCGIGSERKKPAEIKIQQIAREKTELTRDLEQCKAENFQLLEQIKALSAIPSDKRVNPYRLSRIQITRYSNFYDKDNDGKREKLLVYVQPLDEDADTFKAAGTVDVQLWNLNNLNGQALLGEWKVEPPALRKLWFDNIVTTGYRLTFDAPPSAEPLAEPLTVKVTFTDYLTGEVFRDQAAVDPRVINP
jgi:hypothetical protein